MDVVPIVGIAVVAGILGAKAAAAALPQHGDKEVLVAIPHKGAVETEEQPVGSGIVAEIGRVDDFYEPMARIGHNRAGEEGGVGHIG